MKKRIVLAEDHTLLREGLRKIISSLPDYEVVGTADDGLETIQAVEKLNPDLILIDLSMPRLSGIEAIKTIKSEHPQLKVLVLTAYKDEQYILEAFRAGADGYMLKDESKQELVAAMNTIFRGKRYISPTITSDFVQGFLEGDF